MDHPLALKMKDHQDVCEALKDLSLSHFVELGGALGLAYNKCRKFSDIGDLVASWLRREDGVVRKSGEPTWSKLADALEKIGQAGISQDITSKYCTTEEVGCNTDRSNSRSSGATGGSSVVRIDTGIRGRSSSIIRNPHLPPETKEDLRQRIHKETQIMKYKFSDLQTLIRENLNVSPEPLAAHVIGMYILSEEHETRMKNASSIEQIFVILTKYWSFLDFGLLENIAGKYCSKDCDAKRELEQYKGEVQRFCTRRVSEFSQGSLNNGNDIEGMDKLVIILDLKDPSLKYILDLKEIIANILGKPASKLVLCDIGSGSVVVTFWIATSLGKELFLKKPNVFTQEQRDRLKDARVVSLKFKEVSVYKVHQKAIEACSTQPIQQASQGAESTLSDSSVYVSNMDAEMQYKEELRSLYASLTGTQVPATHKVFNLAMIKEEQVTRSTVTDFYVQMTITGKLDDILHVKTPVELGNIFSGVKQNKRKVVLMEGAPGCGKSTLTNYISQQWGEGKIFAELKFKAVILVRLRDPVVQKAESIIDLFPSGDDTTVAQKAMESMRASKFEDVLFIIDGWDELPAHLRGLQNDSIFRRLIQDDEAEKYGLEKSAVIVTSRPVASGNLHKIISARVEVLGFTPEELHNYFHECLGGDSEAVKTLLEWIEENPEIAGTCYLPLNASILVHLFKNCDSSDLPTSQCGIFSRLVCTCILRHFKNCTEYKNLSLKSLDQLVNTDVVKQPFRFLCNLAYNGVMNGTITFSSLPDNTDTLSILHGVESFVKHDDKVKSYNFIHLSVQELLAAFYMMKWLPLEQQINKLRKLFGNPRFNAVFQFYSAMTKLKTPGISDILTEVAEQCSSPNPEDDIKVLLVALFHCLHAAQDEHMCKLVMEHLKHRINLGHVTLNPADCLCIGYFLSYVCGPADTSEFKAKLFNCDIGDKGIKYIVRDLQKHPDYAITRLYMDLRWNNLKEKGSMELSKLLRCDCVSALNLNGNDEFSDPGTFHIAEKLRINTSLTELQLYTCGLTSAGAGYVAKALAINNSLEILNLGGNKIEDEGVTHLASALRVNRRLKSLELSSCGMTDKGLKHITDSLQHNESLEELKLYNFQNQKQLNDITVNGAAIDGLFYTIGKTSTLRSLLLPKEFESHLSNLLESITEDKKFYSQGVFKIEVKGQTVKAIMGIEESDDEPEQNQTIIEKSESSDAVIKDSAMEEEEDFETIIIHEKEIEEAEMNLMHFAQLKGMHGVDVCAETTLVITNSPKDCLYIWEGYGLKLKVHRDCLPPGTEKCTINIKASLSGDYKFPDKSHPVSAVFWIHCEPSCRFRLPISVEIQHCAKQSSISKLSFAKAFRSQEDLPYCFEKLQGSHFHKENSYGAIELDSFSGVCVTNEGSDDDQYVATLFYLYHPISNYDIHLVVTCDTEAQLTAMQKHYRKLDKNYVLSSQQPIEFESESIKPEITTEDTVLKGWKITYVTRPQKISKKRVDSYEPGKLIQHSHLSADFMSKQRHIPPLTCEVRLTGTKESNIFAVMLSPPSSLHVKKKFKKDRPMARKRTQSTYVRRSKLKRPKKAASFEQVIRSSDNESEIEEQIKFKPTKKKQKSIATSDGKSDTENESCETEGHSVEKDGPTRSRKRVRSDHLTGDDVDTIKDEVWSARNKWMNIGLGLNLMKSDLDAINKRGGSDPDECFLEMLAEWLKKADPQRRTWSAMIAVLEKPSVGHECLAEELKKKFINEASTPMPEKKASLDAEELERVLKGEYGVLRNKFYDTLEESDSKCPVMKKRLMRYLKDAKTGVSENSFENIEDVEEFITQRSSFHDYQLLKYMIDSAGAEENKLKLQEYEKRFLDYAQCRVHKCPSIMEGTSLSTDNSSSKLSVKLKLDSTYYYQCTIKDIKSFQCRLGNILGISEYICRLASVHIVNDSLILTLVVYQEVIFPLNEKQKADLKNLGVLELKYRDHKLNLESEAEIDTISQKTQKSEDQPRTNTKDEKLKSITLDSEVKSIAD